MKKTLWLAIPAAVAALAVSQPAAAAVVSYTYTGKIDFGYDDAGLFGGGALTGADFTAVFYRDDDLALPEDIFLGDINSLVRGMGAFAPVHAVLTIAGYTLEIGGDYGEQTQYDDGQYEAFGHLAAGLNSSLSLGGNTLGTFAPSAQNYLAGPDYHTLTSLTAADMPGFSWSGNFTYIGEGGGDASRASPLTSANFSPVKLVVNGDVGTPVGGVPEPATWALMIGGFGLSGVALRRRRTVAA